MLRTRRRLLQAATVLPALRALQAARKDFWETKEPAQWSNDEKLILLGQSPWAREGIVRFEAEGKGRNQPYQGVARPGNGVPGAVPSSLPGAPDSASLFTPMARNSQISRRSLLAAFGFLPAAGLLRAQTQQQQQDPATFSTGVKVVNLFANVRNKKGEIVRDLTKDDFLLDEEGHPQTIAYFSQESDLPLTLGLMVDTSGSQRNLIDQERAASYRFFEQVLRPEKDVAFVIHFDFDTELLQDITSSRRLLEQALEDLSAPSQLRQRGQQGGSQGRYPGGGGRYPGGGGGYPGGGGQGRMRGGGTVLYDAVLLGSDEIMRKQKGRKALVILSDGVDTGSKVSLSSAVEAAQRADTLVYSVLFEDRDAYGSPGGFGGMGRGGRGRGRYPMPSAAPVNGKKVLERISTETGGRFFEVSKKEPLEKIYQEIEEDLRHQYSMGYTPTEHAAGYRKIHLTTKQKGLTVQTREGYYAT